MFSVITNIYNKKIKGPTLMELDMFDVCFTGDMAHIDTIFMFCHTRVNMLTRVWQDVCRVTRGAHIEHV